LQLTNIYASIVTILHNMGDLSTMAFEMSQKMGLEEASSSIKIIALTCDEPILEFTPNATRKTCNTTNLGAIGRSYCNLSIKWWQYVTILLPINCFAICVIFVCSRKVLL
jgi:hypothetical protein